MHFDPNHGLLVINLGYPRVSSNLVDLCAHFTSIRGEAHWKPFGPSWRSRALLGSRQKYISLQDRIMTDTDFSQRSLWLI